MSDLWNCAERVDVDDKAEDNVDYNMDFLRGQSSKITSRSYRRKMRRLSCRTTTSGGFSSQSTGTKQLVKARIDI